MKIKQLIKINKLKPKYYLKGEYPITHNLGIQFHRNYPILCNLLNSCFSIQSLGFLLTKSRYYRKAFGINLVSLTQRLDRAYALA